MLMLWPYVMAAILCFGGQPDPDDVLWMLHQECFAGLALVAVTGSTLLGNEQRSRRILRAGASRKPAAISAGCPQHGLAAARVLRQRIPHQRHLQGKSAARGISGNSADGCGTACAGSLGRGRQHFLVDPAASDRRVHRFSGMCRHCRLRGGTGMDRAGKTSPRLVSNVHLGEKCAGNHRDGCRPHHPCWSRMVHSRLMALHPPRPESGHRLEVKPKKKSRLAFVKRQFRKKFLTLSFQRVKPAQVWHTISLNPVQ